MKGIIFSAAMVMSIVNGSKTQTRRPIKPQPIYGITWLGGNYEAWNYKETYWDKDETMSDLAICKYAPYKPNEILYVRKSRFMPKAAAQLFIIIKTVSVERLQEIGPYHALNEGFGPSCNIFNTDRDSVNPRNVFRNYWNKLYAKKPEYNWEANPFVWAITFERIDKKEK